MPRLSPFLLRSAYNIDPLLPLLLRTCRDLRSARNELRWLREHIQSGNAPLNKNILKSGHPDARLIAQSSTLHQICVERSRGKPLQYILGNQPFGNLEILCRPGVLIPRPETELYTTEVASRLLKHAKHTNLTSLRILDLCTGTGCIALLLHALVAPQIPNLSILGVDKFPVALDLAQENLDWNINHGHLQPVAARQVRFEQEDILSEEFSVNGKWDILISNPPYISPRGFDTDTERSVRNYEPKVALVPPVPTSRADLRTREEDERIGDMFYERLLGTAQGVEAKVVVLEVAGMEQARRVSEKVVNGGDGYWDGCEMWRDDPEGRGDSTEQETFKRGKVHVRAVGSGNGRAVVCWSNEGYKLLGKA